MDIRNVIDRSKLRKISEKKKISILSLLMDTLARISKEEKKKFTLLAVCPNSLSVLRATLRAAKRANAPILFAATLNQVDIDGGYTGWTQGGLVRKIKEESYRINYNDLIIVCVDHGGPWVKDIQFSEKWDLKSAISWIKKSFEAAIVAGYDLLHIDPTIDIYDKNIQINKVVERTLELILHTEKFRKEYNFHPISYEVGTEEVHGGLANLEIFKEFLEMLKEGLKKLNLENIWPIFIVGKVGTDLHTTEFDQVTAENLVRIARRYGSYIKGHYTDFVLHPQYYPLSGIGAANIGPELSLLEYEAVKLLCNIENEFLISNKIAVSSNLLEKLNTIILESGRWKIILL